MSDVSLPRSPNLDQLKHQAKDLLRAYRDGNDDAVREFRQHPRDLSPEGAKLTDAQLILARRYSFDSWPKLRLEVAGRQLRRAVWDRNTIHDARNPTTSPVQAPDMVRLDGGNSYVGSQCKGYHKSRQEW